MTVLAIGTVVASLAATLVWLALVVRTPSDAIPLGYSPPEMLPFVALHFAFTAVGALLAWRRPENTIGWLLCGQAGTIAVIFLLTGLVVRALGVGDLGGAAQAAWASTWVTAALSLTFAPVLVLFPDGRATSPGARALLWLTAFTAVSTTLAVALRPGPLAAFPAISNPYGWSDHGGALDALFGAGLVAGALGMPLTLWRQVRRFSRSTGAERQQLKWFLASMVFLALVIVPAVALLYGESEASARNSQRYAGRALAALGTIAVPIAIGVAILRYRLYDIDLLINRALVYGAVTALLAATYFAAVVLIQALLRPFTSGSELAVAASTLLVVALFQPLRRRVRGTIDRRFYRSRYDAARTIDSFSSRLRDEVELDAVRAELVAVVYDTIRPSHASVWLRRVVK